MPFNPMNHPRRVSDRIFFADATRELIQKRLLFTEYQPGAHRGGDAFGMHATEFGWAVIGKL
jgi:hypothetical protein